MKLRLFSTQSTLRQAAASIFALSTIVPLLVFVAVLMRSEMLNDHAARVGLMLAVLIALLGFLMFQFIVARISDLARTLGAPTAEGDAARAAAAVVPGIGSVLEVSEIAQAFSRLADDLRGSTARLEDLVFKLGTLNEMVEVGARIPSIRDLLSLVLQRMMRAVGASIGSVMLLGRDGQTLRVAASHGLSAEAQENAEVRVGEGIAGKVAELRQPVVVNDIESDERFARSNDPKYGTGSFIALPIRVGERLLGVVNLSKKEFGPMAGPLDRPAFTQGDVQFLTTLVTYMGYAVDNARLLEEAQEAADRLQKLVDDQQVRLTHAQQEMVQAAKLSALGQLVAGVAHELNNPLTILLGFGQLLRDDAPPEMRERIDLMHDAAERARNIVQSLLTFARRQPLERGRVNLTELMDKAVRVTARDLELARVTVERETEPGLPAIFADDAQLQQVLINLITNAKQAMATTKGDRRLRLAVRRQDDDHVRILVRDSGPGIPREIVSRIFEPFMTTKGVQGTGLGLTVSHAIIREHHGELTVMSEVGHGSTFIIELPVGAANVQAPDTPAEPRRQLRGRRILVVEDETAVQKLLRAELEAAGCTLIVTTDGQDALARLDEPVGSPGTELEFAL